MLTRLELVGFKSFADKSRLDFDPGISAIVGPNGSGKSNIVDAIRWILGEQSAKSLRGKEMADVIFNGSGGRRPHGMAEVSLYLDNTRRYLPIDMDEVVLSRRVFRSGEGEYFINGQVARLRDIRDLLLGTGAGHHAYSIIEQGKVDQILQSSNKDRRYIFEEAAGISRFKARKIEALRRLERVQQNLVRVHDIHEEVDRQLRGLRSQAGKARRFREIADRLKVLRLYSGARDFQRFSEEIRQLEATAGPAQARLDEDRRHIHEDEPRLAELESQIAQRELALQDFNARMAAVRESILGLESLIEKDQSRANELDDEVHNGRLQLAEGRLRLRETQAALATANQRHADAIHERTALEEAVRTEHAAVEASTEQLREMTARRDQVQSEAKTRFQELNRLENEQAALESQLSVLWQQRERMAERIDEQTNALDAERRLAHRWAALEQAIRAQLDQFIEQAGAIESDHRKGLEERASIGERLADQRQTRIATASRVDVLEQLRARHEGLDAGVRKIMDERDQPESPWTSVLGVLAEQIEVPAHLADIVELALGTRAQALVVERVKDISDALLDQARKLPGRVQFLAIEDQLPDRLVVVDEQIDWPSLASLVRCDATLRPLVDRILGQTYLADDFQRARHAASASVDLRFITPSGDILEPDGSVSTGSVNKTAGILARAAEIRALHQDLLQMDQAIKQSEAESQRIHARLALLESELGQREVRRSTLAEQARHFESLARQSHDRAADLEKRLDSNRQELQRILKEIQLVDVQGLDVEHTLVTTHDAIRSINDALHSAERDIESIATLQNQGAAALAEKRTALAVVEERLASLREQEKRVIAQNTERQSELEDRDLRLQSALNRRVEVARRLLDARAQLATLYARKDHIASQPGVDPDELLALREQRRAQNDALAERRRRVAEDQQTIHQAELRRTELRMKRDTLAARIAEDYGVQLSTDMQPDEQSVDLPDDQIPAEIDQLREKLTRLGAVNAAAATELDELEGRAATFQHQINDLKVAQKHLEQLIARINEECRRLFLDTFETIRDHFQELFRKLFGGGKADIILEDETDVLETGIEIIARPPGKEPQSISLLSGGEKTLTAVALVMAVFRSKPSPFCILDEVDAALDEANIGRFVQMLRDYTSISQFILITHSKTTMAAADVLHGITQRESGVSIRVSVRLEDVAEDGQFIDQNSRDDETSREPAA